VGPARRGPLGAGERANAGHVRSFVHPSALAPELPIALAAGGSVAAAAIRLSTVISSETNPHARTHARTHAHAFCCTESGGARG